MNFEQFRQWKLPKPVLAARRCLGMLADSAYLLAVTVLTIYIFLGNTEFAVPWKELFGENEALNLAVYQMLAEPHRILMVIVLCRYAFSVRIKWQEFLAAAVIFLCAEHAFETRGISSTFTFLLLVIGARGFSFEKLMLWHFAVTIGLTTYTIIGSQTGLVENLVYDIEGRNIRMAFGFMYPTIFAAQLFFLLLSLWYLLGERFNGALAVLALLCAGVVYKGAEARFTTASCILLATVLFIRAVWIQNLKRKKLAYSLDNRMAAALTATPPLCALGVHVMSLLYSPEVKGLEALNHLLSNRLSLAKKGIDIYGFQLWGSWIPQKGFGGSSDLPSRYFYLDSAFVQLSLINGIVIFGIVLGLLLWIGYRAVKTGNGTLLWILAFISMHALFEDHLMKLSMCPFLLAAFAELEDRTKRRKKQRKARIKVKNVGDQLEVAAKE